jgi:hypothetical protein
MLGKTICASDPGRRLTKALGESQTKSTVTLVVAVVLQTRAPTGKNSGPVAGVLLSSPTMFQVSGVTDRAAAAGDAASMQIQPKIADANARPMDDSLRKTVPR